MMIEQGGRGGVADYTADLVAALAERGVGVEVATARDHEVDYPASTAVHPVFTYVRRRSWALTVARRMQLIRAVNGLAYLAGVARLLPAARRTRLVHLQSGEFPPLLAVASVLVRLAGARIVLTPHNTFDRGQSWARSHAVCQRLAARVVVHTSADIPRLTRAGRERAVVIPHGDYGSLAARATPGDRATVRHELGIPRDATVALVFGQLRLDKGIEDILAALPLLPELHVIVAGADAGAGGMVRCAQAEVGSGDRLHLIEGHQSWDAAAGWFAAADVSLFAYRIASQSGVLLLSYAFETPVIVYPTGGLPDAVDDGVTGWVTARPEVPALVDALLSAVEIGADGCAARGRAGAEMARARFGWSTIAEATAGTYREAACH
ncbi:glycosyltransferase family 4 protein [Actinomycetospora succinea]|nr:glycosyltransferase [Actinomycetospora succinea]